MRVAVVVEQRFGRTPDGRVWTEAGFGYPFWQPYLRVFSEVLVVARVRDAPNELETWTRADRERVGFLTVPHYIGPGQFLSRVWKIRRTAKQASLSREAVILRVPSQIATCFRPFLNRTAHPYGLQVVGDPYEVFAPGCVRHPLRPLFRWWFPFQLRKQCRGACACAYVTERTLQARYPPPERAFVSHYSDVLLPDETLLKAGRRYDDRRRTPRRVIAVGSLQQTYKGVDVLIDAVAHCVASGIDLEATVIGGGRHQPELEAQAWRRGLAAQVRFTGALSDAQAIRAHLDRADVFVLPSRTEGLPRVLLEAMARGLPCIGSAVGGVPELLPSSDMVPAGDATALALKLREVTGDPARLTAMSERNLAIASRYRAEVVNRRSDAFLGQVYEETKRWMDRHPQVSLQ